MYIGVNKTEGWFVVEGGKISTHFTGAAGGFGVPADLTGAWADVPSHALTDAEVTNLKTVPAVNVGTVTVEFDYAKLAAAVTAGIHNL